MGDESELRSETIEMNSNKRKIGEDGFEVAKLKAQEIAARLNIEAETKRPRFDTVHSSDPVLYSHPPPISEAIQQSQPASNTQVGSTPYSAPSYQSYGFPAPSKKMSIPNGKVGVIIGKGGETIKYLQQTSGAKIQITKDTEADPYSLTRDVELTGTPEQVSRAEQMVNDVIAETDTGGSGSSNRILNLHPGAEQIEMKCPNEKVALLIGKGGETIKTIQSRSGARMQIIPLRLPPGDTSTHRSVFISGLTEQIESAKGLVNEIIIENRLRNPPVPNTYAQPVYSTSTDWAPPVDSSLHQQQPQPTYGYMQGAYPAPSPYYSNYPTQQQASWDPSTQSTISPHQPQSTTAYNQGYPQQPDQGYSYTQTPSTNQNYNQGYSQQQPPSYGQSVPTDQQNPYMSSSGYAAYNQQMAAPQTAAYGTYSVPQSGPSPTGYGAPPAYGQTGYPAQQVPAIPNYSQGTNYGNTPALGHGGESNGDGNSSGPAYGHPSHAAQKSAPS